jgi:DMSO/TMAO reductase YedYZ heme-binding membrane subunit
VAFYLMVLTSASFYVRKRIGQKLWRRLHYLTFAAYLLATVHGIQAGTDSGNLGMQLIYWGTGFMVLTLTIFRMLPGKVSDGRRRSSTGSRGA